MEIAKLDFEVRSILEKSRWAVTQAFKVLILYRSIHGLVENLDAFYIYQYPQWMYEPTYYLQSTEYIYHPLPRSYLMAKKNKHSDSLLK